MLKLVALLQELMALSTASPRQPLSKAMSLLVVRLPVDWACLHAISSTGRVVMQVGVMGAGPAGSSGREPVRAALCAVLNDIASPFDSQQLCACHVVQ